MSAQPIQYEDPRDPAAILQRLPERARAAFLSEYEPAAELAAHDVTAWRALSQLLWDWAGRSVAYSHPDYERSRAEALDPSVQGVTLAQLDADRRAG